MSHSIDDASDGGGRRSNGSFASFDTTLEYENRIRGLKNELLEQNQELMRIEDQCIELKRTLDDVSAQLRQERDKSQTRLELHEEEKSELNRTLEESNRRVVELQDALCALRHANATLEDDMAVKCRQIEVLEAQTAEWQQMDQRRSSACCTTAGLPIIDGVAFDDSVDRFDISFADPHPNSSHLSKRVSFDGSAGGQSPGVGESSSLFHEIYEATQVKEFNSKLEILREQLSAAEDHNVRLNDDLMESSRQMVDLKDELDMSRNEREALRAQIVALEAKAARAETKTKTNTQSTQTCFNSSSFAAAPGNTAAPSTNNERKSSEVKVYASIAVGTSDVVEDVAASAAAAALAVDNSKSEGSNWPINDENTTAAAAAADAAEAIAASAIESIARVDTLAATVDQLEHALRNESKRKWCATISAIVLLVLLAVCLCFALIIGKGLRDIPTRYSTVDELFFALLHPILSRQSLRAAPI